ncbi:MAG: sensor histidine kinase [Spirochaetales bacterium]|nr:sensor histidine kinase [Spirochaetales bacterium]
MSSRNFSIQKIFGTAILAVVIAITFFMTLAVSIYFLIQVRTSLEDSTQQTIYQLRRNLNSYVTDIIKIGSAVPDIISNSESEEQIIQSFNVIKNSRNDIVTIDIFALNGELLFGTSSNNLRAPKEIVKQNWFKYAQTHNSGYYFSVPHVQQLVLLKYTWVISYSEVIKLEDENGISHSAVLLIDINQSSIDSIIKSISIGENGYCFLIDKFYNIVYHPKQTLINLGQFKEDIPSLKQHILGRFYSIYNNSRRYSIIDTVDFTGWKIVGISYPHEELFTVMVPFLILISVLIPVLTLAGVILSLVVSNYITLPIRQLEKEVEDFNIETFKPMLLKHTSIEVRSLAISFTRMAERMKKLMDDIVEEQKLIRKSELEALQAKINPHFLYNTLDSIVWFAEQKDFGNIIQMVKALSNMFRISISRDHEFITLEEELSHVESYLAIQQKRFTDKFDFSISLPENLKMKPIIKLLIQPIVENSIYHGIRYLVDPGLIEIKVQKEGEDIIVTVSDTGVGMDKETQESILTTDKHEHDRSGSGIGVFNVNKRIKLTYGEKYGIKIISEIEEGATFEIRIPCGDDIIPVNKMVEL